MESVGYFSLYFIYYGISYFITKSLLTWFKGNRWYAPNFKGELILQSVGLLIIVHSAVYQILIHGYVFLFDDVLLKSLYDYQGEVLLFFVIITVMGLVGWIDDHFGDKEIKGLRGHFLTFIREFRVTSGMLKAVYGLAVSVFCSYFYQTSFLHWVLLAALMLFSIHFFNLLDVRPGRVIKFFWIFLFFLLPFVLVDALLYLLIPVVISTIILFQYDRQRIAMLGDTGSNIVGGIFGFFLITQASSFVQSVFLLLFVGLAVYAEKNSFTVYIQKNPLLSKVDRWGIR
ncbi:hypothetical protein [Bacillus horti]|uniref:UDP-N-acetylmuramyl pentapeptide phosphotransferase/UDP-N-acetylglucosamine-1-phosphate transferase n=1 Tax=Caldalkalibacillus horti TaxID=77523 RepID=A0ABT9W0U2_9BACI|nr:hypothetical protein [Bacillus horti]MDQ0166859.1 UDP-N-acetylmuramyl pentapeptide phosphotransferase/UDP-N-acetylglucosamine-1-phosphate transferase [Bacillus horti]